MIRSILNGLIVALLVFLLAISNQQVAPFAVYIALLAMLLGLFASLDKAKKELKVYEVQQLDVAALKTILEEGNQATSLIGHKQDATLKAFELLREEFREFKTEQEAYRESELAHHKEMLDVFQEKLSAKLSELARTLETIVQDSLNNNTEILKGVVNRQDLSNQRFDENNHTFAAAITEFTTAITSYQDLTCSLKTDFGSVYEKIEELVNKTILKHEEVAHSLLLSMEHVKLEASSSIKTVEQSILNSVAENNQALDRIMQRIIGLFETSLSDFTTKIETHYLSVNSSIQKAYEKTAEQQHMTIARFKDSVVVAINDLEQTIRDIDDSTKAMDQSTQRTLRKIEESLQECSEESADKLDETIKALNKDLQGAITSLSNELTDIAIRFTDYKEEKDIIERLEQLCKR